MYQSEAEPLSNFMKRYIAKDRAIQRTLDYEPAQFKEARRQIEEILRKEKLMKKLNSNIQFRIKKDSFKSFNEIFQIAL